LRTLNILIIVDFDEVARFFAVYRRARRPVRLVADDKIELWQAVLMRRRKHWNALICAEHDRQPFSIYAARLLRQFRWLRRCWKFQLVDLNLRNIVSVLAPLAHLRVAA